MSGPGLGLTIIRQYVELMSGKIEVQSEPGQGSVFRVVVPVQTTSAVEMAEVQPSRGRVVKLAPGQAERRILIVEDNLESRLLMKKLLEPVGFAVSEAANGEEATKVFQEWHPHFIWMDRRMPVMDGLEATRRIKAMEGGKETVIVALTASVLKEQQEELLAAGSDDFVSKPFRADEIFDCMERHLGVRYIYREGDEIPSGDVSELELKPEAFASLPEALKAELKKAAILLDVEFAHEVITRIEAIDSALASAVRQRVDELQFSALHELVKQSEAKHE